MRRADGQWSARTGGVARGLLYGVVAAVGLVFLLRAFVADVYSVRSSSMVPTLYPGDRVLVRFTRPSLERFDLVVFRDPDGGAVVKRVAGLPGESIRILDGDLIVDGAKLDPRSARGPRVRLFDGETDDPRELMSFEPEGAWSLDQGALDVNALGTEDLALASWHKQLRDGWIDADGQRQPGHTRVHDAGYRLRIDSVAADEPGAGPLGIHAEVTLRLVKRLDRFELRLGSSLTLTHQRKGSDEIDVLYEQPFDLTAALPLEVELETVDDTLAVQLSDGTELHLDLRLASPGESPDGSGGARLAFGARDAHLSFTLLEVFRDVHWTSNGDSAVDSPFQLGLDEVFLLGDNSAESADSRTYGPVNLDQLVGTPIAITRPYARARWLD
ncbi:MAG: signal peptidase I [Planctomycetota bacterium]